MSKFKQDHRPLGSPQSWARTPGTYIAAQAHIDGADHIATAMEQKWGAGRLRLLVSPELREKFDRQRYLFNQAIWHGDLEAVRREAARMTAAWQALDKAATSAGAVVLSPEVWEVPLGFDKDCTVAAIVKNPEDAASVTRDGRRVAVFTLEEVGRIIHHYTAVVEVKHAFDGATVEAVRRPSDPLDALPDTAAGLDDPIPDFNTHMAG